MRSHLGGDLPIQPPVIGDPCTSSYENQSPQDRCLMRTIDHELVSNDQPDQSASESHSLVYFSHSRGSSREMASRGKHAGYARIVRGAEELL